MERTRAGSGRREFGRVVLASLADRTRAEVEDRRARGQRLRRRRAERRLAELEGALADLEQGLAPRSTPWYGRPGSLVLVNVVFLAALGAFLAAVVIDGPSGPVVGALDVAMLLAGLLWFAVSINRRRERHPSIGGSPPQGDRR